MATSPGDACKLSTMQSPAAPAAGAHGAHRHVCMLHGLKIGITTRLRTRSALSRYGSSLLMVLLFMARSVIPGQLDPGQGTAGNKHAKGEPSK
jgi:hypothetical protein